MRSVKTQFIVAISLLIITILSVNAFFIIQGKKTELNYDIYQNAESFAELTAERVINNYELNYLSKSFVNFDRELGNIKALNEDISEIQITNYQGEVLYSPEGVEELKLDQELQDRIQANLPSVKTLKTDRVLFLDKLADGETKFVDINGKLVMSLLESEQIENIVYPFEDNQHTIIYGASYENLVHRIEQTTLSIIILTTFGVIIGIFVAMILSATITGPLKVLTEGVKVFAKGDLTKRINVKSKNEVGTLSKTFNQMAVEIEKSTQELVEKERMQQELSLASDIQKDLLPKKMPEYDGIDIFASVEPAEEVGGDCYDFIPLSDDRMIMYVGDVTGHGVPSGIVSAISNALIEGFSDLYKDLKALTVKLNHVLKKKTRSNIFITMVLCIWDSTKKKFTYVSAGHEQIMIYSAKTKEVTLANPGGLALGMLPDISNVVKQEEIALKKGDTLLIYSDGIPEAWQTDKEMYGMERFQESLKRHGELESAELIHDAIIKDVRDFMGSYKQMDDITLMVVKGT